MYVLNFAHQNNKTQTAATSDFFQHVHMIVLMTAKYFSSTAQNLRMCSVTCHEFTEKHKKRDKIIQSLSSGNNVVQTTSKF